MTKGEFVNISDICSKVVSGGTPLRSIPAYYENGSIPWLKTGDIKKNFVYEVNEYITEKGLENSSAKLIPQNSVLVAMYGDGNTAGNVAINKIDLATNQACCNLIIDEEVANYLYVYYYLKGSYKNLVGLKLGGSQQNLNAKTIKGFPIWIPKLKTQKKIAAILSAYDDLIENNKRRIALLEQMAEEIYREWFVRFRFPGYQTAPFEKGISKGWENDKANLFFDHVKGKSYKSDEILEGDENAMPFITLKSFNRGGGYRKDGLKSYSGKYNDNQVVFEGDVVMAVTDMTQNREVVGRVARVPDVGEKGAVISLDVIKLIPKTISATYLYSYMKYSGFGDFIKSFANGANVLHLKPDLVTQQVIVVPSEVLRLQFEALVEPMHEQVAFLTKQIDSLEKTRKSLLPRLISGKLSVEDLDIQFPPGMINETAAV